MEKTATLSFGDPTPVRVQLRTFASGATYQACLSVDDGYWQRLPIHLKTHDVVALNTTLQQSIARTAHVFTNDSALECPEQEAALTTLAEQGNYVFKRLFTEGMPRDLIRHVVRDNSIMQVTSDSEDFFLPWELLFDGPLDPPIDLRHFWGMRYIIARALTIEPQFGDPSHIIQTNCPRVGLMTYDGLSAVVTHEVPTFRRLHDEGHIELHTLHPLDDHQRMMSLQAFSHFLSGEMDILHTACHAYEGNLPEEAYLLVSDEFPIRLADWVINDLTIPHRPLVVLNACLTGTRNPLYTANWAALFSERGARGVLATEFHVPDWFAAQFIEALYRELLAGVPIGKAVLNVRRVFAHTYQNPLGLGYALYSSPSVMIMQAREKTT